jgi:hypothetical protein
VPGPQVGVIVGVWVSVGVKVLVGVFVAVKVLVGVDVGVEVQGEGVGLKFMQGVEVKVGVDVGAGGLLGEVGLLLKPQAAVMAVTTPNKNKKTYISSFFIYPPG